MLQLLVFSLPPVARGYLGTAIIYMCSDTENLIPSWLWFEMLMTLLTKYVSCTFLESNLNFPDKRSLLAHMIDHRCGCVKEKIF